MSSRTSMMILSPQSNHGAKIEDDQNATNQITNETTTLVDTTTDSSYLGTTSLISMYLHSFFVFSRPWRNFFFDVLQMYVHSLVLVLKASCQNGSS